VDHTGSAYSFEPNYRECTQNLDGGSELAFLLSINFLETSRFCALIDGLPCRASSFCENVNLALDCRNLFHPGDTCAAIDCDGNCIAYATDETLGFDYTDNECAKLGYYCVKTYYDLVSCTLLSILPGGTVVRVSTDEGPSDSYGNPDGVGYWGDCYARLDKGEDEVYEMERCDSCDITGIGLGGNYAQFDCSNASDDPCATQDLQACTN
jgi:hypothetical protein